MGILVLKRPRGRTKGDLSKKNQGGSRPTMNSRLLALLPSGRTEYLSIRVAPFFHKSCERRQLSLEDLRLLIYILNPPSATTAVNLLCVPTLPYLSLQNRHQSRSKSYRCEICDHENGSTPVINSLCLSHELNDFSAFPLFPSNT